MALAAAPAAARANPLASVPPHSGAAHSAPVPDVLQQDTRLDALVTLDKTGVSLDDLTHELSRKGLLLFAGRNCENQRVHVRLNKRPLRDLMRALAELLPGEWKPRDGSSGYILIMSSTAVTYRERWQQLHQADRERAYDVMRAKLIAAMRGKDKATTPGVLSGESERIGYERGQTDYAMFHSLPNDLQDKIAANINDIAIDTQVFTGNINEGSVTVPLNSLPDVFRDTLNSDVASSHGQADRLNGANIRFYNIGFSISMGVCLSSGQIVFVPHSVHGASSLDIPAVRGDYVQAVRAKGKAAPVEWKQLAAYEQSRVWKNEKALNAYSPVWGDTRRSDLLEWMAKRKNIEYVSDCYSDWRKTLGMAQQSTPGQNTPFDSADTKELLNEIAEGHDVSWKQDAASIYLLRNNRWYMDDFAEVPAPLLHKWLKRWTPPQPSAEQKASTPSDKAGENISAAPTPEYLRAQMDWRAEVIASLTPEQVAGGFLYMSVDASDNKPDERPALTMTRPFARMANALLRERTTAHFFQMLTAEERDLLAAGQLPLDGLALSARNEAARLLPELSSQPRAAPVWLGLQPTVNILRASLVSLRGALDPGPDLHLVFSAQPAAHKW